MAATIAIIISQRMKTIGMTHIATIIPAAAHLNISLSSETNGISKSTIEILATATGLVVKAAEVAGNEGVRAGNSVPYFNVGKYSSTVRQRCSPLRRQGVPRLIWPSANICGICASEKGPSSRPRNFRKYDFTCYDFCGNGRPGQIQIFHYCCRSSYAAHPLTAETHT